MSTDLNKFLFKDVIWQTEILCNFAHRGIRGEEVPQGTYTHGNRPDPQKSSPSSEMYSRKLVIVALILHAAIRISRRALPHRRCCTRLRRLALG